MPILKRCLVLCGLVAVLVACGSAGDDAKDYRAMTEDEVCALLPVDEARDLMKDITDESLNATKETLVDLPACRYGSGDGRPYLKVSIHQSSQIKARDDVTTTTVLGKEALERDADGSCSVFVPLAEHLYLLALVESWDPDKDTCPVAWKAAKSAYPRL